MSDSRINLDQLNDLIGRMLDDQLTVEEFRLLEQSLRENADYRAVYRDVLQAHASLAYQYRWQPSNTVISSDFEPSPTEPSLASNDNYQPAARVIVASMLPTPISMAFFATAVGLLIFVGITYFAVRREIAVHREISAVSIDKRLDEAERSSNLDQQGATYVPTTTRQANTPSVARIGEAIGVEGNTYALDPILTSLRTGAALRPGWLRLESGMVRIDFLSGARVVVQGPAELEIRSEWEAFLKSGSVSCQVAERAQGFRLVAQGMNVIDLGTEFGLRVDKSGKPEVHVFDGKVAITSDKNKNRIELSEQQAVQLLHGELQKVEYSAKGFTTVSDFLQRAALSNERRFAQWEAAATHLSNDPKTLIHYTFTDFKQNDLQIRNQAVDAPRESNALVIGCQQSKGRWPGKNAIELRGRGDRLLLSQAGLHKQLTGIMWVRIDELTQDLTGLLMSEDPSRRLRVPISQGSEIASAATVQPFETAPIKMVRWEISKEGRLLFNTYQGPASIDTTSWETHPSFPSITPDRFGQWMQIAMVYDSQKQTLKHYINGTLIIQRVMNNSYPLYLGHLAIGNLSLSEDEAAYSDTSREFIGGIDEVLISSRAFTTTEIRDNWGLGHP